MGVWDVGRRTKLLSLDAIDSPLTALTFSPDGGRLGSGHQDGTIRLWDVPSGRLAYQFLAHDGPVRWMAFNAMGARMVSASDDRIVRIWSAVQRHRLAVAIQKPATGIAGLLLTLEHESPVQGLSISSDGATIATWDRAVLRFWNSESHYSVEARITTDLLRGTGLMSLDAISALTADSSMDPALRREALQYVSAQGEKPSDVSAAAWRIVSTPVNTLDAYTRAVAMAEAGWRGAPWEGESLTTLAAAYYRTGRYAESLATLDAAARLSIPIGRGLQARTNPADLAFSAMANQRLGRSEEARRALEQLEALLKGAPNAPPEITALAVEAATVVRGQASQPNSR
jgi:hypothetical protein